MRNKILAELEKRFPGLSKAFLGQLADKLAKKVTEESGIDQAITDFDNAVSIQDLATDFQREGDRRVSDAKKQWDKTNAKKPGSTEETDDDGELDESSKPKPKGKGKSNDDPPSVAKGLIEEVRSLRAEKAAMTIKGKVAEKLKGKVPEKFYDKWNIPETDENLDAFIAEVESSWKDLKQEGVNAGLLENPKPEGGAAAGQKKTGKEEADIKAWAEAERKRAEAINPKK